MGQRRGSILEGENKMCREPRQNYGDNHPGWPSLALKVLHLRKASVTVEPSMAGTQRSWGCGRIGERESWKSGQEPQQERRPTREIRLYLEGSHATKKRS